MLFFELFPMFITVVATTIAVMLFVVARRRRNDPERKREQRDPKRKDSGTGERFTPHVIEPSLGLNRSLLTFIVDAYDEEVVAERERTVLRLHPRLAPVTAAVLPLITKNSAMVEKAQALRDELRRHMSVEYDDGGQIGRRYRRQDEIGTPFAVTIDHQSVEDHTVTLRQRDTLQQDRIAIDRLADELEERIR